MADNGNWMLEVAELTLHYTAISIWSGNITVTLTPPSGQGLKRWEVPFTMKLGDLDATKVSRITLYAMPTTGNEVFEVQLSRDEGSTHYMSGIYVDPTFPYVLAPLAATIIYEVEVVESAMEDPDRSMRAVNTLIAAGIDPEFSMGFTVPPRLIRQGIALALQEALNKYWPGETT